MSILTLFKSKYSFKTSVNPLKFQIIYASFLFYTYKRILYGILTLQLMSNIIIIIKINFINFGYGNEEFSCYIRNILDQTFSHLTHVQSLRLTLLNISTVAPDFVLTKINSRQYPYKYHP